MEAKNINISYYALSFVGRRKNNEDNCIAVSLTQNIHFLAVADGMGGMAAGEIASKLILDTSIQYLHKAIASDISEHNLKKVLYKVFQASQVALANKIHNDSSLSGMGSTLSCVLIYKDKFVVGNIGDSRVYFYRNGQLNQITQDHNYITDFFNKEGKMPDKNQVQRFGHFITKAIDGGSDEADIFPANGNFFSLKEGDGFLVCSDGLITDKSEQDTKHFKDYLIGTKSLEQSAKLMISDAFYSGSTDNISVALAEIGKLKRKKIKLPQYPYPPTESESIKFSKTHKRKKSTIYNLFMIPIIIIIIIIGYFLFFKKPTKRITLPVHKTQNVFSGHKIVKKAKKITWNPFEGQLIKNRLILGQNEDLIWRKPNLEDEAIDGYEVIIKSLNSNDVLLNKKIKTPQFSIHNIKKGQYKLTIHLILKYKNQENIQRSVNLWIKD